MVQFTLFSFTSDCKGFHKKILRLKIYRKFLTFHINLDVLHFCLFIKANLGQSKHFEPGECLQAPVSLWFSGKLTFCLYQP